MITPTQAGQQVSEAVKTHIAISGMTRKTIYTRANMSRDTFDRRLASGESFTIAELVRLAEVLRISPSQLTKPITREEALAS